MKPSHEQNLSAIEKTNSEIERNQTEIEAAVKKVTEEKEKMAIKSKQKEKLDRDYYNAEVLVWN